MLTGGSEPVQRSKAGKRRALDPKMPRARSRVGNGKALLSKIDLRGVAYREFCDIASDLAAHMGGDVTVVEQAILEETAGMVVWCRGARAAMLRGEAFDVGEYAKAVNCLRRLLADIGQQRRLRDITPSVEEYIRALDGDAEIEVDEVEAA